MNRFLTYSIFILLAVFVLTDQASGQLSIPGQIPELEEQVSIIVEPTLPKPYENIKIKVEAYGTNLSKAFITWKVNNLVKKSGRGEQVFELGSGAPGTKQTVSIEIQPVGGPMIIKNVSFNPQELDLIWEARSYTPPFYRGKALQGFLGTVVVVALPNFMSGGRMIAANDPVFKWKVDGEIQNDQSGLGKNSVRFEGDILLQPQEFQVEVTDDNSNKSKQSLIVTPIESTLLLYRNSPLYGILFNQTINSYTLKEKEISLTAMPYFFETPSKSSSKLTYSWGVNGDNSSVSSADTATFRYDDSKVGVSLITVGVKNSAEFLQESTARMNIILAPQMGKIEF